MSTSRELQKRWHTGVGIPVREEALSWLFGRSKRSKSRQVHGFGEIDGRVDLRGLSIAAPTARDTMYVRGHQLVDLNGIVEVHNASWRDLDLTGASLPSLRFSKSELVNCRFDNANCEDWRFWATTVESSSFVKSRLRGAVLGTVWKRKPNHWSHVVFDRTDLRDTVFRGSVLEHCQFTNAKLAGVYFEQMTIRDTTFSGRLSNNLFDGRKGDDVGEPPPMTGVDFSEADLGDVEFRGCRFEDVRFPPSAAITVVPNFPAVLTKVVSVLEGDDSLNARMLRAEFAIISDHGSADSVGVFNRRDYESESTEYADFVRAVFSKAGVELW
jgi:uncharacterized protein YjbI with pentapeptide repeats